MDRARNSHMKKLLQAKGYTSMKHWYFRGKVVLKTISLVRDHLH